MADAQTRASARKVAFCLRRFAEKVVKTIVVHTTSNLAASTPKDTTWAAVNWIPSIGQSFEGTAGTRAEAEAGRIDPQIQAAGLAAVQGYQFGKGLVFITNNVPYIGRLNNGSSKQAPAAFVQMAIARGIEQTGAVRV